MTLDFSDMTPAEIRIKKMEIEKEYELALSKIDIDDSRAYSRTYDYYTNLIQQCQCALYSDRILKGMGINKEEVLASALIHAVREEMGIGIEDVEVNILDQIVCFTVYSRHSVNAFVRKFRSYLDITVESFRKGVALYGGGYRITARNFSNKSLLALKRSN